MVILLALYLKLVLQLLGGRKYGYVNNIIVLNVKYFLKEITRVTTKDNTNVKALGV